MNTTLQQQPVYTPVQPEQLILDKADYKIIAALIDKQTAGEEEYNFDVTYTKGYLKLYLSGTAYRDYETVAGCCDDERYSECVRMDVSVDDICAYDELHDELTCNFSQDILNKYLN